MVDESKLIFIISQPRGGSTLLQKLISNNDSVDTVSEPWLLLPFLSIYNPDLTTSTFNFQVATTGVHDYLRKKGMEQYFKENLRNFLMTIYNTQYEGQYFLDKTPRYYEITKEIYEVFPNSKFIVLKRNPFASLCSMLFTWSNGKIDFSKMMAFYRDFLIAPFKIQNFLDENKNSVRIKEIHYEDLVSNPEDFTKDVYKWLSIPYNDSVLDFSNNVKVAGIYGDDTYRNKKSLISGKVESTSLNRWEEKCSKEPLKSFFIDYSLYLTKDFIEKFGYSSLSWKKSLLTRNDYFKKLLKSSEINLK